MMNNSLITRVGRLSRSVALLLLLLAPLFALQDCNSNGDETISLEYGLVRKLIVGEWIVYGTFDSDGDYVEGGKWDDGTILTFFDDGTYTDSSDGGTRKHTWRLDGSDDDGPYYGGIYLDGTHYDFDSLGDGHWRLVGRGGEVIGLGRDGGSSGSGKQDDGDKPADSGGKGKLVSKIQVYKNSSLGQTIVFYYDSKNRVTSADYSGDEEYICGPWGYRVFYNVKGKTLTLSACESGKSKPVIGVDGEGYGKAELNAMGLVTMSYLDATEDEIAANDYCRDYYVHNTKGEILEYYGIDEDGDEYFRHEYEWNNGCLISTTGNPGGAGNEHNTYTSVENKANINLNRMFNDQTFNEDLFGLALCGYITVKDRYLLDNGIEWTFDKQGYAIGAEYGRYTFKITYTK